MKEEIQNGFYEFANFRLDVGKRLLMQDGKPLSLTPKLFETLLALIQNRGRVLSKDEMIKLVWGDTIVEEGGLARNVSILRKTLGERPEGHLYIVTIPGRGYQFVADVRESLSAGFKSDVPTMTPVITRMRPGYHRVIAVAGLIAAVLIGLYTLAPRSRIGAPASAIQSIAVLPLQNVSGDPAEEYFADGMTDALIDSLAGIKPLRVVSRTSAMSYKGSRKPLSQIAGDLNVDAVIEGSVQRENGRVRIMARLIQASTDMQLWTGRYDRDFTDILKLQFDVARAVADEIRVQLTPEERARLATVKTVDPAAYEEYLIGRYHRWKYIEDDRKRAIDHFDRAIQIDPTYAPAYAGLAHTWWARGVLGPLSLKEVQAPARAAAAKALELDSRLAEAHAAQAYITGIFDWKWKDADVMIERAIELDPNSVDAFYIHAMLLMAQARLDEATTRIERAAQLDPLSAQVQSSYGRILYRARKYNEAILRLERAIELEPRNNAAKARLANVYEAMGKYDKAIALYQQSAANGATGSRVDVARVFARMGRHNDARHILAGSKAVGSWTPAGVYSALGDKDDAFRLLLKSVEDRIDWHIYIKADPPFDNLHSDPRWKELLGRMNLQDE